MKTDFYKYHGAGNDFILIDDRSGMFPNHANNEIKALCDRRFGIGADGLMLLREHKSADFEMLYFNADGKPGSMCGNGGRCIVAFARDLNVIKDEATFMAVDGMHYAKISGDRVKLQMIDIENYSKDGDAYVMNTGSPHYIAFVSGLESKDVFNDGRLIRNNSTYAQDGINVNFVEDKGDHLFVRTFERGVEDETFACGTGVTAVAIANAIKNSVTGKAISTNIKVLGGDLKITFDYDGQTFTNVFLEGPAVFVFKGQTPG